MARQIIYESDRELSGLDRLTGIDSVDSSTKNFTIGDIANFFASTGIADPTRLGFHYEFDATTATPERGKFKYSFLPGLENTSAGVTSITVNRYTRVGADIRPLARVMVGNDLKVTDVENPTDVNYAIYLVKATTESEDGSFFTIDVEHQASSGPIPNGATSLSILGATISTGDRGVSIFDGDYEPTEHNPTGISGDLFLREYMIGDRVQVDLYQYDSTTHWGAPTSLTGIQGFQGIGVTEFKGNQDGVAVSTTATTITVTGADPANNDETVALGTFSIPSGVQGVQGTSVTDVESNIDSPVKGEDQELTFNTTDPITGTGSLPTKISLVSGVQGAQGVFDRSIYQIVVGTETPANSGRYVFVDPTVPTDSTFTLSTGVLSIGSTGTGTWMDRPGTISDHNSMRLYEALVHIDPQVQADANVDEVPLTWSAVFVAGDVGPQGDQGVGIDVAEYTAPTNTTLGSTTTVNIPLTDPANPGTDPDDITFDIPSGVQGNQGIGVDQPSYVAPTNTTPGTVTTVNIPLMDPANPSIDPADISFDIPSGVTGEGIESITRVTVSGGTTEASVDPVDGEDTYFRVQYTGTTADFFYTVPSGTDGTSGVITNTSVLVNRNAASASDEGGTVASGQLTISLTPHMGTVIDTPQPRHSVSPSGTQTQSSSGELLDYAVSFTDAHPTVYSYTITSVTRTSGDTNFVIPSITPGDSDSVIISTTSGGSATFDAVLEATHAGSSETTNYTFPFTLHANAYVAPVVATSYYTASIDGIASPLVSTANQNITTSGIYTEISQNVVTGTVLTFTRPVSGNYTGIVGIANSVTGIVVDASFNNGTAVPDTIAATAPAGYTLYAFPLHLPTSTITITLY